MAGKRARVLVCGDRNWKDPVPIERELKQFGAGSVVIHGGARGADQIAGVVARRLGLLVEVCRADWHQYGRAAGPIRNQLILEQGKPDYVLAFHSNLAYSKGTADMVRRAIRQLGPDRVQVFQK